MNVSNIMKGGEMNLETSKTSQDIGKAFMIDSIMQSVLLNFNCK